MDIEFAQAKININERVAVLPPEIRVLFQNNTIDTFVSKAKESFQLSEEETILLGNDVTLVLLGFIPFKELQKNLQETFPDKSPDVILGLNTLFHTSVYSFVENIFTEMDQASSLNKNSPAQTYLDQNISDIDMKTYMQEEEGALASDTSSTLATDGTSPVHNLRAAGGIRTMGQDVNSLTNTPTAPPTPTPSSPTAATTPVAAALDTDLNAPATTQKEKENDEPVVKSLSQAELQGRHASVPDYTKSE